MKKVLVLITSSFPYGKFETFIESELNYYGSFDKVLCIAIHKEGEPRKIEYPANFTFRYVTDYKFKRDIKYLPKLLFKKNFWNEILTLIKSSRLSIGSIYRLLSIGTAAEHYQKLLKKEIKNFETVHGKDNKYFFYSYWMVEHAMCGIYLKKYFSNSIIVTRAHRYDLYENRYKYNYIPYRKYILRNSDLVLPISKDGVEYLKKMYGKYDNVKMARLGTIDHGISTLTKSGYDLTLVSCSWCHVVKRIDRIISSLAKIEGLKIKWTHIGDGMLYNELKTLAKESLPSNIEYEFIGQMSNREILEFYKNNYIDLFINVSSSEGIPVSIMEVQSFGIPVIATNVGGVNEIITDQENGFLIEENFKDEELVSLITSYAQMPHLQRNRLRETSRIMWEKNYSAKNNYTHIFNKIAEM